MRGSKYLVGLFLLMVCNVFGQGSLPTITNVATSVKSNASFNMSASNVTVKAILTVSDNNGTSFMTSTSLLTTAATVGTLNAAGTVSGSSFSGSGANLTGMSAGQVGAQITNNNLTILMGGNAIVLTNAILASSNNNVLIITTNFFVNTNVVFATGADSNIVNQVYTWNGSAFWTNPINDIVFARSGGQSRLTNAGQGVYYRLIHTIAETFNTPGQMTNTSGAIGSAPCAFARWGTNTVLVTNRSSLSQTTFPVNEFNLAQSWVSPLGNDLIARRGSRQFPFATFKALSTNCIPGDVINVDSGKYYESNVVFAVFVTINGPGPASAELVVRSPLVNDVGINMTAGAEVSGMTFSTTNQPAGANNGQLGIAGRFDLNNCVINGDIDALFPTGDNLTNTFKNSAFNASFDVIVTPVNTTNNLMEFFNCSFNAIRGFKGSQSGNLIHGFAANPGGSRVNVYGGSVLAQNGATETYCLIASTGSSNVFNFYGTALVAVSTNGSIAVVSNATTTAIINFSRIINTNFVINQVYSNSFTKDIQLSGVSAVLTEAIVAGSSVLDLFVNNARFATVSELTTVATLAALKTNSFPTVMIPNRGTWFFTNTSSGAGNSSALIGGQIFVP